jgi:hypothetical protein
MATIRLYYGRDTDEMVRRLKEAKNGDFVVSNLEVRETAVLDENVIEAIADLLLERSVETVHLDACGAHLNKQALRMARALGNVKNVRLSEPTFLSQYFLDFLLMSATKLENLRIQDHLDCRQIEALASGLEANSSLATLDLSMSRLDSFSILAKGLKMNSSLQTLRLRSLGLRDEHVDDILDSIKHHPTLKSLDLSFNYCRNLNNIAEFLDINNNISELVLGYQNMWQSPKIDINELAKALKRNTSVAVLSLPRNKLSDQDAGLLATALLENSTLKSLDVRENLFSDDGIITLANAAEKGPSLRKLNVMKNPFGIRGSLALLTAVRENTKLVHVELGADNVGQPSQHIRYFTALNRGGRRLLYENPPLSLWPLALERVSKIDWDEESGDMLDVPDGGSHQLDVLYFLLQGPVFFEGLVCRNPLTI